MKEILPFVTTWMDLEDIVLSKISQTEKDTYCIISFICGILKKKIRIERDQICGYQRWEVWVGELDESGQNM